MPAKCAHATRLTLAFRVAGRVQTRPVEVGTQVKAGQVIATLDPQDYALAVVRRRRSSPPPRLRQNWRSRTCNALANCARRTSFPRPNSTAAGPRPRRPRRRARQLRAEAARQGNQQAYTRLTAPHAGVVTAITLKPGQVVAAGQPVAQLARSGEREVRIDVPENALDALRAARTLTIRLWAAAGRSLCGPPA